MKKFSVPLIILMIVMLSASPPAVAEAIEVIAEPVALYDDAPDKVDVDTLQYRGGLVLSARHRGFGGFSGLGVSADGKRMISVSDAGMSLSARLLYDDRGHLTGLGEADLGTLADLDGKPLAGKRWADAEAMAPGVDGSILVAFERDHRIWAYPPGQIAPMVLRPPHELAALPGNDGIEALTLLNDGRLFAIAEGDTDEDESIAWVSSRNGWDVLIYIAADGFRPTGAATLPGGDVLVLERFYTPRKGVRIRIKRVAAASISAGETIRGDKVAEFSPPMTIDNFEGIETRTSPNGETFVYLISDDNFSNDQRTLLMMFALRE